MVGAQVEFIFSDEWKALIKTAVFIAGGEKRIVSQSEWRDNICTIPHECLAAPDLHLLVGVFGTNAAGSIVIPTVYADLGMIWTGADTDGETGAQASPELWAQLLAQLGLKEGTENRVSSISDESTDGQYPTARAVYKAIAAAASVVIEGTVADDMSEVTISTPDAWSLVSEAWNSKKAVVLRLGDEACAYLSTVGYLDPDDESSGMALFSLPSSHLLGNTPAYSIWLFAEGGASIYEVEGPDGDDIALSDIGGYYSSDTVEGALQEIGAELAGINTLLGSGVTA